MGIIVLRSVHFAGWKAKMQGKIKFLGTAPGMPTINQRHSCIYFQRADIAFLVDCGEGASLSYMEEFSDFESLSFIFITHLHPDHFSGIYMFIQMLLLKKRENKLQIFLPESIEIFRDSLQMCYLFSQKFSFALDILDCRTVGEHYPWFEAFQTDHLSALAELVSEYNLPNRLQSFGIKLRYDNKVVTYTSDIQQIESIKHHLVGSDYCIIDGIHPPISDFIELAELIKSRIYITHGMIAELGEHIYEQSMYMIVRDKDTIYID
jgi:ribonuclease BN (tRNA processing enzyme)